jgi:nucleoside-diphosphate-sugar epimerase
LTAKQPIGLVTGAGGFLGTALRRRLRQAGWTIIAVERPGIEQSGPVDQWLSADVSAEGWLPASFQLESVNAVFHLAGISEVGEAAGSLSQAFGVNAGSTWLLLRYTAQLDEQPILIFASTLAVFGDSGQPHGQRGTLPVDSYGASKACAELLARQFAEAKRARVRILRFGNVYGPGDRSATRLVPGIMRSLRAGKEPALRHPEAKRHFIYVDDAADACLWAATQPLADSNFEAHEIHTGQRHSVAEVGEMARRIATEGVVPEPPSAPRQAPEGSFAPSMGLRQGLAHTWRWYRRSE